MAHQHRFSKRTSIAIGGFKQQLSQVRRKSEYRITHCGGNETGKGPTTSLPRPDAAITFELARNTWKIAAFPAWRRP
jgi:hypothetical protein